MMPAAFHPFGQVATLAVSATAARVRIPTRAKGSVLRSGCLIVTGNAAAVVVKFGDNNVTADRTATNGALPADNFVVINNSERVIPIPKDAEWVSAQTVDANTATLYIQPGSGVF